MNRNLKFLLISVNVLLLLGNQISSAQENFLKGRVVDELSGKAVEYAYIHNYSLQLNTYCNSDGEFSIAAREGDTLVLYGMGYYYQKVIVSTVMFKTPEKHDFPVKQQAFDVGEAKIVGYSSYQAFKQDFITLEQEETLSENLNNYIAGISRNAAVEAYEKARNEKKLDGITFASVPILTPEEKERIKLGKIKSKEAIRDQVYQKFNPRLVKEVTGLTDDDEIIAFMIYCDFPDKYLLEVNEYEIMTRIAVKYELFKRKKEDDKLMKNPINRLNDPEELIV